MKALCDQHRFAMPHGEDFIELLILSIISLYAKAIGRREAEIIYLFQVGRTRISIMTVRGQPLQVPPGT